MINDLFGFFRKIIENDQQCVFFYLFAPWQETFADAGDGDGERGWDHLGPFGTNLVSFWNHLRIILRPPKQKEMFSIKSPFP